MSDKVRRYLAQQIQLGGQEVVLEQPPQPQLATHRPDPVAVSPVEATDRPAIPRERERSVGRAAPASGPPSPADASMAPASRKPDWRKGAPPIPGPGLVIEPPVPSLLADELADLTSLDAVAEVIRTRTCGCPLCPNRTHAVPGEGDPRAKLLLIGEGPGATEDATGRPFVGQAGKLLDEILLAIELPREKVYITNIVKCRPPQNRKPLPDEIAACIPFLHRQLELLRPKVIVALGGTAGEALLGTRKSLGELRGKVHRYGGVPLIVTYHPAALLRNPNWKKPTWDDVRIARQLLDG